MRRRGEEKEQGPLGAVSVSLTAITKYCTPSGFNNRNRLHSLETERPRSGRQQSLVRFLFLNCCMLSLIRNSLSPEPMRYGPTFLSSQNPFVQTRVWSYLKTGPCLHLGVRGGHEGGAPEGTSTFIRRDTRSLLSPLWPHQPPAKRPASLLLPGLVLPSLRERKIWPLSLLTF